MNGISAGPIKTLAAAGIGGFGKILKFVEENAPLRRNVTTEDVGNAAAFLLSDLAARHHRRDPLRRRGLQPRGGRARRRGYFFAASSLLPSTSMSARLRRLAT